MSYRLGRRHFLKLTAAAGAVASFPGLASARAYPSRNITLLVGFSAGGLTDTVGRLVADFLREKLDTPCIVVNKPGAAGALALNTLAKARPDGHTLMVSSVGQIAVVPHLNKEVSVDPRTDISNISLIGEGDFVFTVHQSLPIHSVDDLKAYATQNPGKLLYGTSGAGGNLHLATELFLQLAGIQMEGVHYPGSSALMPDLLNNQVQLAINVFPAVAQYVAEGTLRPILVTGSERKAEIPDVPCSPEVGMDTLATCQNWFGLHAPPGTPDDIVERLAELIAEAVISDDLKTRLNNAGLQSRAMAPKAFSARVMADYDLFGSIAERAGLAG